MLSGMSSDKIVRLAHVSSGYRDWQPLARTPVEAASAASLASFSGVLFAFVLGTDHKLYSSVQGRQGTWGDWSAMPDGVLQSEPVAVVHKEALFVFVRGSDNAIYCKTLAGSWNNWTEVPGGGRTISEISAVSAAAELVLLVRGTDNRIFTVSLQADGKWSGWSEVPGGGKTAAGPSAAVVDGTVYVAVCGLDNRVYVQPRFPGGRWEGHWTPMGSGTTLHRPTLSASDRTLNIFVCGQDGRLWTGSRDARTGFWSALSPVSAPLNWIAPFHACNI
jgi:hypothetical protein